MKIKRYQARTPSLRQRIVIREEYLEKKEKPYKGLTTGKRSTGGRNNLGRITSYYRGGGHKRLYRKIDTEREIGKYSRLIVKRLEYDPNRSANIALCETPIGKKVYILAPQKIGIETTIIGRNAKENKVNREGVVKRIKDITEGTKIYNIQIKQGEKGVLSRAAGTSGIIIKHQKDNSTIIRLPSKKIYKIESNCIATIGEVSNSLYNVGRVGKAGGSRWKGIRPRVRAVAKNPIDHPHGGKTPVSGGLGGAAKNRWGKIAKWKKTRRYLGKIKGIES